MERLRKALVRRFEERGSDTQIHTPENTKTVELYFRGEKMAKVIGELAAKRPRNGEVVSGVLTHHDFQYRLLMPDELEDHTELRTGGVKEKLRVKYHSAWELLIFHLERFCGSAPAQPEGSSAEYIRVRTQRKSLEISWFLCLQGPHFQFFFLLLTLGVFRWLFLHSLCLCLYSQRFWIPST
jgi:cleavage and polyadenylation specificity factor subunit 3